jgi:hypothetical protein
VRLRVLFYCGTGAISVLIRRATCAPYAHVAIAVDGHVFEARRRGVRCLEGAAAAAYAAGANDVVDLVVCEELAANALRWLEAQVGRRYAFGDSIAVWLAAISPLRLAVWPAGRWACGGLVASALERAGALLSDDPRLETPGSLYAALQAAMESPTTGLPVGGLRLGDAQMLELQKR